MMALPSQESGLVQLHRSGQPSTRDEQYDRTPYELEDTVRIGSTSRGWSVESAVASVPGQSQR